MVVTAQARLLVKTLYRLEFQTLLLLLLLLLMLLLIFVLMLMQLMMFKLRLGLGVRPIRESISSEPRVVLDRSFVSSSSYSSSSESSSSSLCLYLHPPRDALSLSLSHYYLSMILYTSLSSLHISPRMSLQQKTQGQLTEP